MDDWESTVISQYANSATLLEMIETFNDAVDPTINIDSFYKNIWDISTAYGYGLDVWGRIVNISRQLTINDDVMYFGFNDGINDYSPFGQQSFYQGTPATKNYRLSDDAYKSLILVKAMTNIAATNIPTLNKILTSLFTDRGRCYVNDMGNMMMRYTFEFVLEPFEKAVLSSSGALAHPTGVLVSYLEAPVPKVFGFCEAGPSVMAPFGQGTFIQNGEVINASQ